MDACSLTANLLQLFVAGLAFILGISSVTVVAVAFGVVGLVTAAVAFWVIWHISHAAGRISEGRWSSVVQLARISAPFAVSAVMIQVITNFDVFVLGLTHPSQVVGSYEPVMLGVMRLTAVVSVFLMVAYLPAATRLMTDGHHDAYAQLYVKVSTVRYIASWPIIILLAIAPSQFFRLLFGPEFLTLVPVVRILLLGFCCDLVFGLNGQALVASGAHLLVVKATAWPLLAMVVSLCRANPAIRCDWSSMGHYRGNRRVEPRARMGVTPVNRSPTLRTSIRSSNPYFRLGAGGAWLLFEWRSGSLVSAIAATACAWIVWVVALRMLSVVSWSNLARFLPTRAAYDHRGSQP